MTPTRPRVLLVLPTRSYRAAAFLDAAASLGMEVVVAAEQASSLAERLEGREMVVDLGRPGEAADRSEALHARHPLEAVVGVDESAVSIAAAVAERLGLRHHPVAAVAATRDKRILRRLLGAASVRQPAFSAIASLDGDAALAAAVAAIGGYPVVIKPVALAASQGVLRADDPAGLAGAVARIAALLDRLGCDPPGEPHPLLVEHFVPGAEVAVEALVRAGRVDVLAIFDKPDPLDGPAFAETLYISPTRLAAATRAAVTALAVRAIAAVGLTDGPAHVELRIHPTTGPVLLEVAARSIGGLCSRAVSVCAIDPETGGPSAEPMPLEEAILRHAAGLDLPARLGPAAGARGVLMLPVVRRGTLASVSGVGAARMVDGVRSVEITIPVGSTLEPLPEGDRYLGFVVATGEHPLVVERSLRAAWRELEVAVSR